MSAHGLSMLCASLGFLVLASVFKFSPSMLQTVSCLMAVCTWMLLLFPQIDASKCTKSFLHDKITPKTSVNSSLGTRLIISFVSECYNAGRSRSGYFRKQLGGSVWVVETRNYWRSLMQINQQIEKNGHEMRAHKWWVIALGTKLRPASESVHPKTSINVFD